MEKRYNLSNKRTIGVLIFMGLALLVAGLSFPSSAVSDEVLEKGRWVKPDHYPGKFHGMGIIDKIHDDGIIINDRKHFFSLYFRCHTPGEMNVSIFVFREGNYVGYMLNSEHEMETLYLLK